MRNIRLGGQGCNIWTPSMHKRAPPPIRDRIAGWTEDASRRNRAFLFSVDPRGLVGDLGYAVTLTLAQNPANAEQWSKAIDRFLTIMRRAGMIRYHWVTEWTKQGRPHLHASLFFAGRDPVRVPPNPYPAHEALAVLRRGRKPEAEGWAEWDGFPGFMGRIVGPMGRADLLGALATPIADWWTDHIHADAIFEAWQRVTGQALSPLAQHVERIRDMGGWSAYTAKHAARGVDHYQRQALKLPPGWVSTGRLWAKGGEWPTKDERFEVDDLTGARFRRGLRRWLRAAVRAKLVGSYGKRRKMLLGELRFVTGHRRKPADYQGSDRAWSEVCGLSTFAPAPVQAGLWEWAMSHPAAQVIDLQTGEVIRG